MGSGEGSVAVCVGVSVDVVAGSRWRHGRRTVGELYYQDT